MAEFHLAALISESWYIDLQEHLNLIEDSFLMLSVKMSTVGGKKYRKLMEFKSK